MASPDMQAMPEAGPTCLGPLPQCSAAAETATLLLLLPGAFLSPHDYSTLMKAMQAAAAGRVKLWVGAAPLTPQQMMTGELPDVQAVMQEAVQQGFDANVLNSGRANNVFAATHSFSGIYATQLLQKFGALIQLATCQTSLGIPGQPVWQPLESWGRPVLHVAGMLDGQQRPAALVPQMVESATLAAKVGTRYAAVRKPVVMLPGINHGLFSNGVPNTARGDLESPVTLEDAAQRLATVMVDFITVHRSLDESEVEGATVRLQAAMSLSAELMTPLTRTMGLGDVQHLLQALPDQPPDAAERQAALQAAGCIMSAVDATHQPGASPSRPFTAHPGELTAAEEFAVSAQLRMLGAVPTEAASRVHVVATAHLDDNTFIYSQPTIAKLPGDKVLLNVHVYLDRPYLRAQGEQVLGPRGPTYVMKLKKPQALLFALTHDVGAPAEEAGNDFNGVTGAMLSAAALEEALQLLPATLRAQYDDRSRKPCFVDDRDVSKDIASPVAWIRDMPISVTDTSGGCVDVQGSYVSTAPAKFARYDTGMGCFAGNHYVKALSPAWFAQWCMTDGLREKQLPSPS